MNASGMLSRRNIGPIYKTLKVQITACLLCLMIVGVSLDGLPDPPAVKPHGNQSKLVSQADHHAPVAGVSLDGLPDPPAVNPHGNQRKLVSQADHHAPVAANDDALNCVARAPHVQAMLLLSSQFLESRDPSFKLTFVRRAADSSPPCSS